MNKFIAIAVVAVLVACANAAPPTWNVIAKGLLTTDLGIAFVNTTKGYTAGDANGSGPAIMKSTDGGHNWTMCEANFGIDMLLLGAAASEKTIIVSSIFGELYSNDDGASFHQSIGGGLSQSVRFVGVNGDGGHVFGCAGTYGGKQGVIMTKNNGVTFTRFTTDVMYTMARYAVYPSDDVWYVAAGEWPNNSVSADVEEVVRPRKSAFQLPSGRFPKSFVPNTDDVTATGNYYAQIAKTTDGGKTFTSVFSNNGSFYFNEIDCNPSNPNHCCAVGESPDGPNPGARIYCTTDGETWTQNFFQAATSTAGYSLMGLRFANETSAWASGSKMNAIAPSAWFLYTNDGGKTWDSTSHQIFGYAALALDVVTPNVAYAAVDDLITQTSGVAKYVRL